MGGSFWLSFLTGRISRADINKLADLMGLPANISGSTLAGNFKGREITVVIRPRQSRSGLYNVLYQCTIAIPPEISLIAREHNPLLSFLRPHPPIAEQTGRNLIEARFHLETTPPVLEYILLNSLDFCYSLLLFPLPSLIIDNQQLTCQPVQAVHDLLEVPATMEKICQFVTIFEQVFTEVIVQSSNLSTASDK